MFYFILLDLTSTVITSLAYQAVKYFLNMINDINYYLIFITNPLVFFDALH